MKSIICRWWRTPVVLLLLFQSSLSLYGQADNVGAGRAISFDGIDDYIDLGNIYDDLTLPLTISAWVYVDPTSTLPGPVFASQDNIDLYNGFWFFAAKSEMIFEYGDGFGANSPAYRQGKKVGIPGIQGKWTHVCGVMRSPNDVQVYVNGINVGGASSGTSNNPMNSNFPNDVAKIGYFLSNGIIYRFKGLIDELRVFNRDLSESEIRNQMCKKLVGTETGLIGYWTFDEMSGNTLNDKSTNNFDGVLIGNPTRVFSGAPLGDVSGNLYPGTWTNNTFRLDNVEVKNVLGNPEGVHIYRVNHEPSQTGGLSDLTAANPYYGVFVASLDRDNTFDINDDVANACTFFIREDNSIPQWSDLNELKSVQQRTELVTMNGEEISFDLGLYRIVCDQQGYLLKSDMTDTDGKTFLWSTGETTPEINITKSGLYSLEVSNGCGVHRDTVNVLFAKTPSFSLGPDATLCLTEPTLLRPYEDAAGFVFKWQDGSTADSFAVTEPGTYWVTAQNICGAARDSIIIEKKIIEVPELGSSKVLCDQVSYTLQTGIVDLSKKTFAWSTGQSSSSIEIDKSGIYHVAVTTECGVDRDTVSIILSRKPAPFDLGDDQQICVLNPTVLKPYEINGDFEFEWQDGSTAESLTVTEFGTYSVTVRNACGDETDSIEFIRKEKIEEIPNIITPNDDPLNQYFVLESQRHGPNHLILYNRWGELIFSSTDYRNDWDAHGVPPGVYFYRALGNCIGERKGTLTVSK